MPYINIDNKEIFYREFGEGEAVVFLNGLMMSTSSWMAFVPTVSKKYKMITVDLLDQGRTQSCDKEYTIEDQAVLLNKLISHLGINSIHLIGMSYGGKVALTFALRYQSKVKTLTISNTDSRTINISKEIFKGWAYAASTLDGEVLASVVLPYMYSYIFYEKNLKLMEQNKKSISKLLDEEWKDRFLRALHSLSDFNVSHLIKNIKIPTLIISSELDAITLTKGQEFIHNEIENSQWVTIREAGHAALYEKPEEYIDRIMNFLES